MKVSTHELKRDLAKLLATAERGEKIVVTRYGRPVVEIGPAARTGGYDFSPSDPMRKKFGLSGSSVPVDEDFLNDPAISRQVLGLREDWAPAPSPPPKRGARRK